MEKSEFTKKELYSILPFICTLVFVAGFFMVDFRLNDTTIRADNPEAKNGIYTLTCEDLQKNRLVSLGGEWAFYPELFLSNKRQDLHTGEKRYLQVPGGWNNIPSPINSPGKAMSTNSLNPVFYGTYHLTLINRTEKRQWLLYFPAAFSEAFTLYIDDEKIAESGKIATSASESQPEYRVMVADLDLAPSGQADIWIQTSSFQFENGGLRRPILLGERDTIQKLEQSNSRKDVFIIGILCGFIFYFSLTMIINRKNDKPLFYLIYASVITVLYTATSNAMLINEWIPDLSFRIMDMWQYMLAISGGCLFILLIHFLYEEESQNTVKRISLVKTVFFLILNVVLERQVISRFILLFSLITLLEFLYGIYILSKAIIHTKEGIIPLLIGTAILLASILYDQLLVSLVIFSPFGVMTPIGLTVFILSFAVIVSIEHERTLIKLQETKAANQRLEENKVKLESQNIELQQLHDLKAREASTDFLTGLFNRRYIDEALQSMAEISMHDDGTMSLSILLIDVDYFKQINDRWGHDAGDAALQKISSLLKKNLRGNDIAGRYGGDEFIVLLPAIDLKSAKLIADRFASQAASKHISDNNRDLQVTLSIGCISWKGSVQQYDFEKLITAADTALYKAKEGGRNQCCAESL